MHLLFTIYPFEYPFIISVFNPGSSREVVAPVEVSEQMVQKLRGKNEFTVLATLKQDHLNSGVILSIHHSEHRLDMFALYVINILFLLKW